MNLVRAAQSQSSMSKLSPSQISEVVGIPVKQVYKIKYKRAFHDTVKPKHKDPMLISKVRDCILKIGFSDLTINNIINLMQE
jgi:hypothetical protein